MSRTPRAILAYRKRPKTHLWHTNRETGQVNYGVFEEDSLLPTMIQIDQSHTGHTRIMRSEVGDWQQQNARQLDWGGSNIGITWLPNDLAVYPIAYVEALKAATKEPTP
jgi:hypothetical protein